MSLASVCGGGTVFGSSTLTTASSPPPVCSKASPRPAPTICCTRSAAEQHPDLLLLGISIRPRTIVRTLAVGLGTMAVSYLAGLALLPPADRKECPAERVGELVSPA